MGPDPGDLNLQRAFRSEHKQWFWDPGPSIWNFASWNDENWPYKLQRRMRDVRAMEEMERLRTGFSKGELPPDKGKPLDSFIIILLLLLIILLLYIYIYILLLLLLLLLLFSTGDFRARARAKRGRIRQRWKPRGAGHAPCVYIYIYTYLLIYM